MAASTPLRTACGTTLEELVGLCVCKKEELLRNQVKRPQSAIRTPSLINSGEAPIDQDVVSTFLFGTFCGHASRVCTCAGEPAIPTVLKYDGRA